MLYVSIFVELLRARPGLTVVLVIALQAGLWTLVPGAFYPGPPGNLPLVLAIGHEWRFAPSLGSPLAYWLAELVFDAAGHRLIAVYALSQACVAVTYWAVFRLGREIVGARQAVLAVLLMAGISSLTVASTDFGPAILAMPIWALLLKDYWLTIKLRGRRHAIALGIDIALLLLTSDAALLLIGILAAFTLVNERARQLLRGQAWLPAAIALASMLAPHVHFLASASPGFISTLAPPRGLGSVVAGFSAWLSQIALLLGAHAGLIVLVAIVIGFPWSKPGPAPVIARAPVAPLARRFIYSLAAAPALSAATLGALLGEAAPLGGTAPLVVLSGLAVIVAAGDAIALARQNLVIAAWFGLLLAPPVLAVAATLVLPLVGIDLVVNQPAAAMARFFADSFERRIGSPVTIVAGDPHTAALIGLGAPSRPSLYLQATPSRSPWVSRDDIRTKGAIVVWPTNDTAGTPPRAITESFPDLTPEVPRTFERRVEGQLPLLRYGWAVIRPQTAPPQPPAPEHPPAETSPAEPK
jgi:hypothetical protein